MYKKGFTLIELIATIIILGLIGLIVYPTVNNVINDSKEKVYKHQIEELVRQADVWVANNQEKIGSRSYILTFDQLYRDGIINQEIYINNSHVTGRSGGNVGGTVNHSNYGLYTYDGKTISSDGVIGSFASDRTLGTKSSTTGNIYGAYDMSGGLWEFVMANAIGTDGFSVNLSEFTTPPDSMDYDIYINSTSNSGNYKTSKLGDALGETRGWYNDTVSFPSPTAVPFIIRGGISSYGNLTGIFADLYAEGMAKSGTISTRVTISKK